jgi:glycosyltransferase involved in cell wall biosynthesis
MRSQLIRERGLSCERVKIVPNWSDADSFKEDLPVSGEFRARHEISDRDFVAMFAGSLTMSAGVELYVDVAEKLRGVSRIRIVMAGDGSRREWIEREIERRELDNLRVVPLIPEEVPIVQAGADVLLLSLTGDTTQNAAPSKQVAYMFSGKPIIASVSEESTVARIVRSAGAGTVVLPDSPQAVADQLMAWSHNETGLEEMGQNARQYAMENFSKRILLPRMADLLEEAARSAR